MQKRHSYELLSRKAKSSEELLKDNKKSITDLFFKGLCENDSQVENGLDQSPFEPTGKSSLD